MKPRCERKVELFSVTANSCEAISVNVTFKDMDIHKAKMVAEILEKGFRDVEVVSQETGEVIYRHYVGSEYFKPYWHGYGEAIANAEYALANR
jgi:hypothetical protein